MFDRGSGPPLVLIPGIQGRWEWMMPTLRELEKSCRALTYSLCGDFRSALKQDASVGFEAFLRQLDDVLDRAGVQRVALCGISYGGIIGLRYAATRPDRVSALVLASAPAPGWVPSERQQHYVARPWLSTPAFVVTSPLRLWPEICAALPDWRSRLNFSVRHTARVLSAPMLPPVMAARVRMQQALDFAPDCARIKAPTLVVTGEESLDRVVPVSITRTYASMIPGAQYTMMERTGHIGSLTQPQRFAEIVSGFVHAHHH